MGNILLRLKLASNVTDIMDRVCNYLFRSSVLAIANRRIGWFVASCFIFIVALAMV